MLRTLAALAILALARPAAAQEPAVELVSHDVTLIARDLYAEPPRVFDVAVLTLRVRNTGDVAISAWRAMVVVRDPFGEELFRARLTAGRTDVIAPGATEPATFEFSDDPSVEVEPYEHLAAYAPANLRIELTEIQTAPVGVP